MNLKEIILSSSRTGLINFDSFHNKPIVIFNSASLCGFTSQLHDFQKIYETEKIIPIAIPTNNFGDQEPGNDFEIYQYYSKKFAVTFPIIDKTNVDNNFFKTFGAPDWNFNKYLFNIKHNFIKKFDAYTLPFDLLNYV